MKKLLILIVFGAVFLHYYPQPWLTSWFEEQKETVLDKVSEATDTHVKLKAEKIFQDLSSQLKTFTEEEKAYVKSLTSSREKVKDYYHKYCETKAFDGELRAANQKKVCEAIARYQAYF
jgi:nitrogen fixation/metabolism regulation signal transduction histidine kinase